MLEKKIELGLYVVMSGVALFANYTTAAIMKRSRFNKMPDNIPMHWYLDNQDWKPDMWINKQDITMAALAMPLFSMLVGLVPVLVAPSYDGLVIMAILQMVLYVVFWVGLFKRSK